jgi:predicted permease
MLKFFSNLVNSIETPSKKNQTHLAIGVTIVALIAIIYAMKDEEKFAILKKDFTNPIFTGIFVAIIILSVIGLNVKEGRLKNATRHATIAFVTAYLAHLNMSFAVFFIVGLFVYYMDTDVTG